MNSSRFTVWTLCSLAAGCGAYPPPADEAPAAVIEDHPDPAVTIAADRDTTVELYDLPRGVLVMESGLASRPNTILKSHRELIDSGRLVELFTALRPDLPVPPALSALQTKLPARSHPGKRTTAQPPQQSAGLPTGGGSGSAIHPNNACDNNCCDYNWLNNNLCGDLAANYDYSWFLFNYGWSAENDGSMSLYSAAACAGVGTSTFKVNVSDGSGGTWSVLAGHYRTYYWAAGCYPFDCPDNQSITTSVNSQSNEHLHTYCGGFWN